MSVAGDHLDEGELERLEQLVGELAQALEQAEGAICADNHPRNWFDDCPAHPDVKALLARARAVAPRKPAPGGGHPAG